MADYLDNTGVNGLANIGNTCYMNCILQCLSHCRGLRDLFLLGQYKQQINRSNPIGTGGKTAEVYHSLLQDMWASRRGTTNPHQLKSILASKSDLYSGFQQQDAQEFLSVLLDTLHEDLNQGDIKKTFEMPDGDGKCDEEVAGESWNFHKQRNESFFVENFMGQYKSKVSCLECGKVSITFDPYMYLSLPMAKDKSPVEYCFLALATAAVARCKVYAHLPIGANVLLKKISEDLKIDCDKLTLFKISKSTIVSAFVMSDMITAEKINEGQLIVTENKNSADSSMLIKVVYAVSEPFPQKTCASCGTGGDLKRCLRCRKVSYCNQECQKKHYKNHKFECKAVLQTVGIPQVLYIKQKDLKFDKLQSFLNTANFHLNFIQSKKVKPRCELRLGNETGTDNDSAPLNSSTKSSEIINAIKQGTTFVLVYDNSSKNLLGQQEFEIFDHDSFRSVQPKSSLGDCFSAFTQEECLPDSELWRCPRCKKLQKATKQISLYSCPNYLIVHLKRFQAKNIIVFDKIDKLITFPTNNLDLLEYSVRRSNVPQGYYVYDLYGVANHYGSLYRGHYTAYARLSGANSTWREFDDRTVTDMNENSVQSSAAYVLFYKRRRFTESISRGIVSSDEDEEEYFDACTGVAHKDISDHSDDNSCYFEAKVPEKEESPEIIENIIIPTSPSCKLTQDSTENMELDETESQKTAEGSSSSDVSCDYIKVGSCDLAESKLTEDECSDRVSPIQDEEVSNPISLDTIQINFEDQLD
ncbi:hypothetical protein ACHWQZ_G009042 [Mnemiopsis leidyi]